MDATIGPGTKTELAGGKEREAFPAPRHVRIRWGRVILVGIILLGIIAGAIYSATHKGMRDDGLLEKPKEDGPSRDLQPCDTARGDACGSQACPTGTEC